MFQNDSRRRHEHESVAIKGKSTGEMAKSSEELSDTCFFFFCEHFSEDESV